MRVRQVFLVVLLLTGGLATATGNARAAALADMNVFTGSTVVSSSYYNGSSEFITTNAVDGTANTFVFSDPVGGDSSWYLQIRGFSSASAIDTLRLFSWSPGSCRAAASVSVYYSSNLNDGGSDALNPSNYTFLRTTSLATLATDPGGSYAASSADGYYSDVANLGIAAGAQSILLKFGKEVGFNYGPAMNEVQGFSTGRVDGQNILSGKTVTTTSYYLNMPDFDPSHVTDGSTSTFVFSDSDTARSMAITGFDSSVSLIRIWKGGDRVPDTVSIGYTTVADSVNPSDYTSLIDVTDLLSKFNAAGYADIAVSAPTGTKGLGFVWGPGDNSPGAQILEIQAFTTIPEPSALALAVCGLFGLLAYAWRKRR